MRAALLDADEALAALVVARQVTWTSGAATLYRSALADAVSAVHRARAATERVVPLAAAVDAR